MDELADRRAEQLRVVGGEDVAEVAAGDDDVELADAEVGHPDLLFNLRGGVEIVGHLRDETAYVDGVGRGEEDSCRLGGGADRRVGEDALDRCLRVIEVAADGDAVHVLCSGGGHLQALDARGAGVREEHRDLDAGDIGEAGHRRRAGVAGGGGEDEDAAALRGGGHEDGQHGEGHVLERARGAVEELEHLEAVGVDERRGVVRRELGEKVADGVLAYCFWHVVEERAERDSLCVLERGGWDGQVR